MSFEGAAHRGQGWMCTTLDASRNAQNLQQYVVERSVEHMRKWGKDYDMENLEWSQELLENSCSKELRNLVSELQLYHIQKLC